MDTKPRDERATSPFDWQRPLRVIQLARRVGVTPWEALSWLEAVLADFESQERLWSDCGDSLPWNRNE